MNEKSIGKVFEGWETDGVLGSGTFGTVYLAHTSVENMPVYGAVKVIKIPPNDEAILNAENLNPTSTGRPRCTTPSNLRIS